MAITLQPFVRFTSFNFWLVGLRALYQLGHLPTLADPLDPRLGNHWFWTTVNCNFWPPPLL